MKFAIALTAFVAVAVAAPTTVIMSRDVFSADAPELCIHIKALKPLVKACAVAAKDKGKNVREDGDCIKAAIDAGVTAPDACKSCE